jgi:hypothetical protein
MRSMNSMSPSLKPAPGFFSATALATKRSVTQASTRASQGAAGVHVGGEVLHSLTPETFFTLSR